jgi:hypothetical protein
VNRLAVASLLVLQSLPVRLNLLVQQSLLAVAILVPRSAAFEARNCVVSWTDAKLLAAKSLPAVASQLAELSLPVLQSLLVLQSLPAVAIHVPRSAAFEA